MILKYFSASAELVVTILWSAPKLAGKIQVIL